jgi:hypothetical protein
MAQFFYRVGQFWRGLRASVSPEEQARVARVLPVAAIPLFTRMPVDAQRHSLNVLASVRATGEDHPDLAVAALLHDCGKVAAAQGGVTLGLWLRGPLVVLEALLPRMAARWAASSPLPTRGTSWVQGWRYALYVQREHPAIGAHWAAEAGCSPLSCWLIAHHQTPLSALSDAGEVGEAARVLLARLQQADNGN